jgi:hypothetical protein
VFRYKISGEVVKVAKNYKRQQGLTIEQLNAIDLLVTGMSDQEVADKVGVNRVTVTSWRLYDPYFQAELNKRRKEIWGASIDKMRNLIPKALETVENAIKQGDVKTALEFLKMAGMGDVFVGNIGEDEPEKIIEKLAKEKEEKARFDLATHSREVYKKSVLDELDELADRLLRLQQAGYSK